MRMRWLAIAFLLVACGGKYEGNGPDGGPCDCPRGTFCSGDLTCIPDGTCNVDGDCGPGKVCTADHTCEIGGCGGEQLDLTYVPPNFIIVLDRSCSMDRIPAGATQTKWTSAVGALGQILTLYPSEIEWGLTLFPDTTGVACAQDANAVAVGPGTANTIKTLLQDALQPTHPLFPDGPCVTNIDTGLLAAAADPGLASTAKTSYLMLVTDGRQSSSCSDGSDAGSEAAIADLFTNRGIKTFVVGFGGLVDGAQLDTFATLGGTALSGAPKYYQADTPAQLQQAFQQIVNSVVSCEYTIDPAPPDLAQTFVFFEKSELVPHDPTHMNGWDYDPVTKKLRLYGSYCSRLESQQVDDVDVVFGCPMPPLE